jgi:glyoxylase-like metal-dependent hydrolase (beta-lactamase superfamily II)
MARRQEQEDARTEVTELAPGVLRMELPISMPGLGHVNCYALIDGEGAAVVDPGLPGPASWKALKARLKQADLRVKNIHTVIVSHSHPDHFGGAMRIAKESGAQIVAHNEFRFGPISPAPEEPEVSVDDLTAQQESLEESAVERPPEAPPTIGFSRAFKRRTTPWGGEGPRPPFKTLLKWSAMRWIGSVPIVPQVSKAVKEGEVLKLAGREFFVVHTPGHTEDHICLHDPADGLFLAGDHVLPTITPHISGLTHSPDPLADFFESLDRVAEIAHVNQVLPAHGHPFADLATRCQEIKQHHYERLEKVKSIARELGPSKVEAFSQRLFKPRSWGAMADSETYAHLEHLRLLGDAERGADGNGHYVYSAG